MNDKEIREIISELTFEEKIKMIHGAGLFRTEGVERKKIPPLRFSDGPLGVRNEFPDANWVPYGYTDDFVSYLPSGTALASTWNPELSYRCGQVLGEEARGRGKDMILGPGINIMRSPLCGRNFEYMSEDPFLVSKICVPYIKGVQENDVSVCVKHFAVNNQETERLEVNVEVSERALQEIYFPAFKAAVEEGDAYAFMCAYNRWEGLHCSANKRLLTQILKSDWHFDGVVVSDWGSVHDSKGAAEAGLDIDMNVTYDFDNYCFARPLMEEVKSGHVDEKVIDDKVARILRLMDKIHIFSSERKEGCFNTPEHQKAALDIARESVILLKNQNCSGKKILPLNKKEIKTIAVIGENADVLQSHAGGSAEIKSLYEITPLLGITMAAGGNIRVKYERGYSPDSSKADDLRASALKLAQECDAVIYVGGCAHYNPKFQMGTNAIGVSKDDEPCRIDSEGFDRDDLTLPYGQDVLLCELLKLRPDTVTVIFSGNAVDMSRWINSTAALIQTTYNGMEGGRALAEVIFGKVNPSGKLPYTIPKRLSDCPAHSAGDFPGDVTGDIKTVHYREGIFVGYRYFETFRKESEFCFGHGLSYTDFEYSDLNVIQMDSQRIKAVLNVKNTGARYGKETVQIYLSPVNPKTERSIKELKAFKKIELEAGETKRVVFEIHKKDFARFDENRQCWITDSGKYEIMAGSSVKDIRLKSSVELSEGFYEK
ncbi:glycoside hydrolase family 3 C-terminal domain-containing protein [Treponema sp.]|uniref:beta-glucosidase family protein n=1 Tax=Treponema sp. TaxID=166 RepID=UPI00257AE9AA|nr:glycoside hydrolase family 3 C-terminal domain-containing protein [Treponema sp.]MBE6355268.1 glycosyl hydrolase [Treponema sp.]